MKRTTFQLLVALSIGIEPICNHWESKNAENIRWDN